MSNRRILFLSLLAATGLVALVFGGLVAMQPSAASAQDAPINWPSSAPVPEGLIPAQGVTEQRAQIGFDEHESPNAPTQIRSLRVAGSAVKPRSDNVSYIPTGGGGCMYASAGDAYTVFNAPIYLPQGSLVEVMRVYYDDTSTSNSTAWFTVYDLYGNIVQEWAASSVGNAGNGFNDTATISHTIDYQSYSYVVNWRPYDLGSDMQLCGFRIFYEPPPFGASFLPLGVRND